MNITWSQFAGKEFGISEREFQRAICSVNLGQNDVAFFFGVGKIDEKIVNNKIPISLDGQLTDR